MSVKTIQKLPQTQTPAFNKEEVLKNYEKLKVFLCIIKIIKIIIKLFKLYK